MDSLLQVKLGPTKKPSPISEFEHDLVREEGVSIVFGEKSSHLKKGIAFVTSHSLQWIADDEINVGIVLPHLKVANVELVTGGFLKIMATKQINIHLKNGETIKLSFHNPGRTLFLEHYKNALVEKLWERDSSKPNQTQPNTTHNAPSPTSSPQQTNSNTSHPSLASNDSNSNLNSGSGSNSKLFSTTSAGVGGIIRTVNEKSELTTKTLDQAFTDLNALMQKAKDLVALAEKFSALKEKEESAGKSSSGAKEDQDFRSYLLQMGISSPVTKQSAGSTYHERLSKELSDWLISRKVLSNQGGMIALPDLYCLFNRARGTEMISPEDLYRATVLFENLILPVRLRKFDSGVLVVQTADHNDESVGKFIISCIEKMGSVTALDVSKASQVSLSLALEQLLASERLGLVCRDETFEGLVFYKNFFMEM